MNVVAMIPLDNGLNTVVISAGRRHATAIITVPDFGCDSLYKVAFCSSHLGILDHVPTSTALHITVDFIAADIFN